jgi:hypothetical protein
MTIIRRLHFLVANMKKESQNCRANGHKAKDCRAKFHKFGGQNGGNHNNF